MSCKDCERREKHWERIYQRLNTFWSRPAIRLAKEVEELKAELAKRQRRKGG